MKKAVLTSLLAIATILCCVMPASAQITIKDQAEYNAYTNAVGQSTPQAKAAAIESFLTTYPQTVVKQDVLEQLMTAYSTFDAAKALTAADRLLQADPTSYRAITLEALIKKGQADAQTDPAKKQADLDDAATWAQKGLTAAKPATTSDADFQKMKATLTPLFYGILAADAMGKKDYPTAITNFKAELAATPLDQTSKPGPALQDTFYLGLAYYQSTPPDYINCTWYASRAAHFAPEPYKSQMLPTAKYCYTKYHGKADGFDAVDALVATNLNPPADFTITPAPKPADYARQTVASTPDLTTLALSDKEFILANGTQTSPDATDPSKTITDADKVWAVLKGVTTEVPGTVIAATADSVQLAVSDDAVQGKTADFTINMKTPLKTPPAVGDQVKIIGTFDSYTPSPLMIIMKDGEMPAAKKPTPAHHTPAHKKS